MPNGHSENGNSGYESPQPESPGPSNTQSKAPEPESPEPSPAPSPVKADVTIENGEKEADTSKESVEEGRAIFQLFMKPDRIHIWWEILKSFLHVSEKNYLQMKQT